MTELTPDLIVDQVSATEPQVSPSGHQVAYALVSASKAEDQSVSAIWIADIGGVPPPRRFTAGTAADRRPQWSPDGGRIAFLSDRATRGVAQLYVINVAGGEATAVTPIKNKRPVQNYSWSPEGNRIAFISADEPTEEDRRRERERDDADVYGERWRYARLRVLSLADGTITTIASGDRHIAAFAWAPGGDEIAYTVWQTPALEASEREIALERVAVAGGEPRPICRFAALATNLVWSSDSTTILVDAPYAQRPQSSRVVWAASVAGGEPRRLALGETSCCVGLAQPLGAERAVVRIAEGLDTRVAWIDPTTGALETICTTDAETLNDLGEFSVRSVEGRVVVAITAASSDKPWELWAGHPNDLRRITDHQAPLADVSFGPQEAFRWNAPDGLELDGLLIRPPAASTGPLPMIVLVHGGPYGRWSPGLHLRWGDWGQWLATAGYAVLMPNPRGGFGHGERFAASCRADVGGADFADVLAAVDAAVERGIADPRRLGIGGWSQGGFMSAWAIARTERFKAAIAAAAPTDWGLMVETSDLPVFERALAGSAPWDGTGPHRHAELSPIAFARHVTTPVLIVHGQHDARVPLNQAISFQRALREFGAPVEMVVYPREAHDIAERAHQVDLLKRVRAWFDRWLRD